MKRSPLRALLLAPFLAVLLGAAPETGLGLPIVVVYPLTSSGPSAAETGSNVAIVLASKLAELGGISIKAYTAGTGRPEYLAAARAQGADYYITGFMTPVGTEVSLIVQVVSTSSGSVVYSTTTMARTYADAGNQADALHDAILRHASRGLPALGPPLPAAGTPVPSASDAGGVNLSRALGRRRKRAPAGQATATPVAAVVSPAVRGTPEPYPAVVAAAPHGGRRLVAHVGGSAGAAERDYATAALATVLRAHGAESGVLAVTPEEVVAHIADLCKANPGVQTLYAGSLAVDTAGQRQQAALDLSAYDCNGAPVIRRRTVAQANRRGSARAAIDRAANAAVDALSKPPGA